MVESRFSSQKSSYFFFSKKKTKSQAGLWISWLSLSCGLVSKENWSFPKKARIILKDHFSLSLKMQPWQSAATRSPGTGETHSQESLHPQVKEGVRVLVHVASPGTVYKESQQTGTWHSAGMNTHTHTEVNLLWDQQHLNQPLQYVGFRDGRTVRNKP